jgi:hypothetical protein
MEKERFEGSMSEAVQWFNDRYSGREFVLKIREGYWTCEYRIVKGKEGIGLVKIKADDFGMAVVEVIR